MRTEVTFFIDRGMGSRLVPEGLRAAGWNVTTMDERYGVDASQAVADVEWIAAASRRGEVLLSKDKKIAKRPLEAAALIAEAARVVVISDAQVTGSEMLARLLENAIQIERFARTKPGPWVVGVSTDGIRSIRIR